MPADIADDYELSDPRLAPLRERAGAHRVGPGPGESLARRGASAWEVSVTTLAAGDVEAPRLGAGLTGGRLLEPPG